MDGKKIFKKINIKLEIAKFFYTNISSSFLRNTPFSAITSQPSSPPFLTLTYYYSKLINKILLLYAKIVHPLHPPQIPAPRHLLHHIRLQRVRPSLPTRYFIPQPRNNSHPHRDHYRQLPPHPCSPCLPHPTQTLHPEPLETQLADEE